jgi:hypothetical protein
VGGGRGSNGGDQKACNTAVSAAACSGGGHLQLSPYLQMSFLGLFLGECAHEMAF